MLPTASVILAFQALTILLAKNSSRAGSEPMSAVTGTNPHKFGHLSTPILRSLAIAPSSIGDSGPIAERINFKDNLVTGLINQVGLD